MSREFERTCKSKFIFHTQTFQEVKAIKKKIHTILDKDESERTEEERIFLKQNKKYSKIAEASKRYQSKKKEREKETEDDAEALEAKCEQLVNWINEYDKIVIYTGAGISTSASIPDYRGPNGVWTQLNKGCDTPKVNDLVFAEPTYTHMAIAQLVRKGIVKHVVSQNCDGLHIRSGIASRYLSEIHGNMYVEVCKLCKKQYWRTFDVTEKTGLRRHSTGRFCHSCPRDPEQPNLIDTIVHFGEKGKLKNPLNWDAAARAVRGSELIICLGSSLKVLKTYYCLWPKKGTVKLVIVNLQWTPKDSTADLKINGKCDEVMKIVMSKLELIPSVYDRSRDPILRRAIPLSKDEEFTCSRIKMEQITKMDDGDSENISETISPGWFGKGLKIKTKPKSVVNSAQATTPIIKMEQTMEETTEEEEVEEDEEEATQESRHDIF